MRLAFISSFCHKRCPLFLAGHAGGALKGGLPGSAINPAAFEDRAPRWIIKQTDYGVRLAAQRNSGPDHYSWRINQWLFPFATLIAAPASGSQPTAAAIGGQLGFERSSRMVARK